MNPINFHNELIALRNEWAVKVADMPSGSSRHKTASGILRGIQQALELLEKRMEEADGDDLSTRVKGAGP